MNRAGGTFTYLGIILKFLAIDPGKTTGIAIWEKQRITSTQIEEQKIYKALQLLIDISTTVIVEDFTNRPGSHKLTRETDAAHIIGYTKGRTRNVGAILYTQQPSMAKHYCPDFHLKEKGLYNSGSPHANDALRHLLLFGLKQKIKLV